MAGPTGATGPAGTCDCIDENLGNGNTAAEGVQALSGPSLTGANNTGTGWRALANDTSGESNSADGFEALSSNTSGNDNTGIGFRALHFNTIGTYNTATGHEALLGNINGAHNTAVGHIALRENSSGSFNTAFGDEALLKNTTGNENSAIGFRALNVNTTGDGNVGEGYAALGLNTTGYVNTATGVDALEHNTTGHNNTAAGYQALEWNDTGINNTAVGSQALYFSAAGSNNIGVGFQAGLNVRGTNDIEIGNTGVSGDNDTIRIGTTHVAAFIAGIYGTNVTGLPVYVDSNGQLGLQGSSQRFKQDIKPMDCVSEAILSLKPVTFVYKTEFDAKHTPQFGLIAEEVAKIDPDLVVRGKDGQAFTVRYDAVNMMLLNEFLKQHQRSLELEQAVAQQRRDYDASLASQQRQIEVLTASLKEQAAQIQKVGARLEVAAPAPQVVGNNQ